MQDVSIGMLRLQVHLHLGTACASGSCLIANRFPAEQGPQRKGKAGDIGIKSVPESWVLKAHSVPLARLRLRRCTAHSSELLYGRSDLIPLAPGQRDTLRVVSMPAIITFVSSSSWCRISTW